MDVSSDLTFGDIEMNACPRTKLLDYAQEGDHILDIIGDEGAVIRIPPACQYETTRGNVVSLARGGEPSNERFNHKIEK